MCIACMHDTNSRIHTKNACIRIYEHLHKDRDGKRERGGRGAVRQTDRQTETYIQRDRDKGRGRDRQTDRGRDRDREYQRETKQTLQSC